MIPGTKACSPIPPCQLTLGRGSSIATPSSPSLDDGPNSPTTSTTLASCASSIVEQSGQHAGDDRYVEAKALGPRLDNVELCATCVCTTSLPSGRSSPGATSSIDDQSQNASSVVVISPRRTHTIAPRQPEMHFIGSPCGVTPASETCWTFSRSSDERSPSNSSELGHELITQPERWWLALSESREINDPFSERRSRLRLRRHSLSVRGQTSDDVGNEINDETPFSPSADCSCNERGWAGASCSASSDADEDQATSIADFLTSLPSAACTPLREAACDAVHVPPPLLEPPVAQAAVQRQSLPMPKALSCPPPCRSVALAAKPLAYSTSYNVGESDAQRPKAANPPIYPQPLKDRSLVPAAPKCYSAVPAPAAPKGYPPARISRAPKSDAPAVLCATTGCAASQVPADLPQNTLTILKACDVHDEPNADAAAGTPAMTAALISAQLPKPLPPPPVAVRPPALSGGTTIAQRAPCKLPPPPHHALKALASSM